MTKRRKILHTIVLIVEGLCALLSVIAIILCAGVIGWNWSYLWYLLIH